MRLSAKSVSAHMQEDSDPCDYHTQRPCVKLAAYNYYNCPTRSDSEPEPETQAEFRSVREFHVQSSYWEEL